MSSYSDFSRQVSDLELSKGDALAHGKAASANAWGGTLASLGERIPLQVQQVLKQRAEQREKDQIKQIFDQSGGDLRAAVTKLRGINPKLALDFEKELNAVDEVKARGDALKAKHDQELREFQVGQLATATTPSQYASALAGLHKSGFDVSGFDPEFSDAAVERANRILMSPDARGKTDSLVPIPGPDGKTPVYGTKVAGQPVYEKPAADASLVPVPNPNGTGAVYGAKVAGSPVYEKAGASGDAKVGSFEDYVTRTYGDNPTSQQVLAARKAYGQADDRPTITVNTGAGSDVAETVRGMKDGTLPPLLPGRASKEYIALMAEAHRQGFDLAGAATDWMATQKHIASLNGSQQLRLTQSINQLPELLDSVDALADQWKGGKFPPLNKARLALAKNGALGEKAASIARQLDTQIADVTADLGNVYMGGNSPTDHALKLAATALGSDWSEKVLKDMTALARKNVQTRLNSIRNTGVAGASPNNQYAPAPAVAPPTGRYNPKTGKVE